MAQDLGLGLYWASDFRILQEGLRFQGLGPRAQGLGGMKTLWVVWQGSTALQELLDLEVKRASGL